MGPADVVAFVDDLMDRSRLEQSLPGIAFARDPGAVGPARIVLVDLARHGGAIAELRGLHPDARIVAFGPHVDDVATAKARADGADAVLPRSRFFRDPAAALC